MSDVQDNTRISENEVYFNVPCIGSAIFIHVWGVKDGCCVTLPCRTLLMGVYVRFEVDRNLAKNKNCVDYAFLASDGVA